MSPYLLPDSDVSLLDQDTCMVDGFCKPKLENLGLKTAFKKIVNFQTKNIIKLHLILREDSSLNKATEKCISFKQTFGILFLKSEQISGSSTDLCQGELNTPYLRIDIILHINVTRRWKILPLSCSLIRTDQWVAVPGQGGPSQRASLEYWRLCQTSWEYCD